MSAGHMQGFERAPGADPAAGTHSGVEPAGSLANGGNRAGERAGSSGQLQLDIGTVVDELTALCGAEVIVEVHVPRSGSAPHAILAGTAGALSMDNESRNGEPLGLLFLPIGAKGSADPGSRPGIYFDEEHFASAQATPRLRIALEDETVFLITDSGRGSALGEQKSEE